MLQKSRTETEVIFMEQEKILLQGAFHLVDIAILDLNQKRAPERSPFFISYPLPNSSACFQNADVRLAEEWLARGAKRVGNVLEPGAGRDHRDRFLGTDDALFCRALDARRRRNAGRLSEHAFRSA